MDLSANDITYIRLLITDTQTGEDQIFSDGEINAVASHETRIKRIAARLLRSMAISEVLVAKKIRTQDLQTDGPAVAAALRALADDLLAEDDEEAADELPAVFVEPYVDNDCQHGPELTRLYHPWPF